MSDASKEKERHLKRYFAWNPNANRVQDELFQQSEFFDPSDLMLVKYEMLRRVRMDGISVVQAAAAFGFSRSAFYKAENAWSEAGMVGLLPSRPGPRGGHKLTDEVMDFMEMERADYKFSSLILGVVKSVPFQLRRGEGERNGG